jgi:LPXTG-motif cell wall-anchored protein
MHLDLSFIRDIIETWGYVMVFAGIAIESSGIPFPGETVLLVASAIAASSARLHIEWVIVWAAAGAIIGDNCGYWAGREIGQPLLKKIGPILHFDEKKQDYLERYFEKHGAKTVFIARFIALLRAWTAFFAGLHHMHYPTFLQWNALGGIIWATGAGLLGYFFGQNLPLLEKWLGNFSYVLLGLALIGGLVFYFVRRKREHKQLE